MSTVEWRLIGLQVVTGLVVAFVRHDLEKHRVLWDSFEQFAVSWFIHTIGVMVLTVIVGVPILRFHKFFLGYQRKGFKDEIQDLTFNILMTVLVASICIFFVAHYVPTEDD
jgi:uncharacterized membrane-anchored protein YhcB (DUF1043 family)